MSDPVVYAPETIYETYIVTTLEKLWTALTSPEFTRQYFMGRRIESNWKTGSQVRYRQADGTLDVHGAILKCDPPRVLEFARHIEWIPELQHLSEDLVTFQLDRLDEFVRLTMTESHREGIEEKLIEGGGATDR